MTVYLSCRYGKDVRVTTPKYPLYNTPTTTGLILLGQWRGLGEQSVHTPAVASSLSSRDLCPPSSSLGRVTLLRKVPSRGGNAPYPRIILQFLFQGFYPPWGKGQTSAGTINGPARPSRDYYLQRIIPDLETPNCFPMNMVWGTLLGNVHEGRTPGESCQQ